MSIAGINEAADFYCRSPIERQFLITYLLNAEDYSARWEMFKLQSHMNDLLMRLPLVVPFSTLNYERYDGIMPQARIDRYRADFLICRYDYDVLFDADGNPGDEILRRRPLLVVECDGHDFHERTKEQAAHDKERDREMQIAGYRVMRFTGSEIHRDVEKCVAAVNRFFEKA